MKSQYFINTLFDDAYENILDNNFKNGIRLVQDILIQYPGDQEIWSTAVNVLLEGNLYEESLELFTSFKANTGKDLVSDFTIQDIEKWINENEIVSNSKGDKIFRYISVLERGFLSGMRRFFPINKITLNDKSISFHSILGVKEYKWGEIDQAYIVRQKLHMGYLGHYWQKIFVIESGESKVMFDVSPSYPDYKGNKSLVTELKKRLSVKEYHDRKVFIFNWPMFIILSLFCCTLLLAGINKGWK